MKNYRLVSEEYDVFRLFVFLKSVLKSFVLQLLLLTCVCSLGANLLMTVSINICHVLI